MPRWIIAEGEELGQEPPGAAIWQPSPHLRQCPLVFGGAAVWHEFRCRAKCRPRRDRTSARFEPRRRHLDRAEQRAQPPGDRRRALLPAPPITEQAIATTRRCLQHPAVGAQGLPDRPDVDLERIVADRQIRPDARHQVILGDEFTCRLDKNLNNIKGAAAQRDRLSARAAARAERGQSPMRRTCRSISPVQASRRPFFTFRAKISAHRCNDR